jgi:hypothetical protein
MAITNTIIEGKAGGAESSGVFQQFAQNQIELFSNGVDQFMRWERERIFKNDPTPEERSQHKKALRMFLMLFQALRYSMEPDFPDNRMREIVKHQIWRLEQSWKAVYEPISEEEAVAALNDAFPNDPMLTQLFPDDGTRA